MGVNKDKVPSDSEHRAKPAPANFLPGLASEICRTASAEAEPRPAILPTNRRKKAMG